ncbi:DedA family protein [Brachybacterium sp. GCM10030267]|uniref:DedA family protein n=1 Tax=unclassified Brachybacterium TaxID=2623841 RepID=UPI003607442F
MEQINDFILQAAESPWLLLVMFIASVIDGFFPPIPSETVLVAAVATAAATGEPVTIVLLGLLAAAGAIIGDNIAYLLGRTLGNRMPRWMQGRRFSSALARAQQSLEQRGAPFILSARFIPVGRVAVNISAGVLRYPWPRFAALSVAAGLMWSLYSTIIGVVAGQWLGDQPLLSAVIGVVVAGVIGLVVDRVRTARGRATARAQATPALLPAGHAVPDRVAATGAGREPASPRGPDAPVALGPVVPCPAAL